MNFEILLGLINLIAILVLILFKNYAKKKGENLATKEDIGKITEITERTKLEFLQKLEQYKKELDLKYELIQITKDSKKDLFIETVNLRKNLVKIIQKRATQEEFKQFATTLINMLYDIHSNEILFNEFSEAHKSLSTEFNKISNAITNAKNGNDLGFDFSNLQVTLKSLQKKIIE